MGTPNLVSFLNFDFVLHCLCEREPTELDGWCWARAVNGWLEVAILLRSWGFIFEGDEAMNGHEECIAAFGKKCFPSSHSIARVGPGYMVKILHLPLNADWHWGWDFQAPPVGCFLRPRGPSPFFLFLFFVVVWLIRINLISLN